MAGDKKQTGKPGAGDDLMRRLMADTARSELAQFKEAMDARFESVESRREAMEARIVSALSDLRADVMNRIAPLEGKLSIMQWTVVAGLALLGILIAAARWL